MKAAQWKESCRHCEQAYRMVHPRRVDAVLIKPTPTSAAVSFRGTCNVKDVCQILDIRTKKIAPNVWVHHGIYNKFMALEPTLTAILHNAGPIQTITFSGHSVGGAMAFLAAYHYRHSPWTIQAHSFGGCKVGNATFMEELRASIQEVSDIHLHSDIVRWLPITPFYFDKAPCTVLQPYRPIPAWKLVDNHSCRTYYKSLDRLRRFHAKKHP